MNSSPRPVLFFAAVTAASLLVCNSAQALFAEVKPSLKVGRDCVGKVSVLAPKLSSCNIADAKVRIWCPSGKMFEGGLEREGPPAALARSLCNMTQVP